MRPAGDDTVRIGLTMAFAVALALASASAVLAAPSGSAPAAESAGANLRASICLNGMWETAPASDEVQAPDAGWKPARTPALPISDEGHPPAMWYRLALDVPSDWGRPGRQFTIEFEKVGHYAAVLCNGQKVGEHYGQFSPFAVDLTPAFKPGERNTISVYVHDASGRYVRPGAVVSDPMVGPSYRPGAQGAAARNWIGIVGDVTLSWRPAACVDDVFVVTSVRQKSLEARLDLSSGAAAAGMTCRAAVLDGDKVALELPEQPAAAHVVLTAPWADPVLWGPPTYGEPKLYMLRTELVKDGQIVDRSFTRFGFREVWVSGRDVLLNGRKLWMVGTYKEWLAPSRYINDRRPMAAEMRAMQAAGLNTLNGHWDDLGRTYLDLCDETGMLAWSAMYCNSMLPFQPSADEGWADWMVAQAAQWAHAERNHPSIMAWRPFCVTPKNLSTLTDTRDFLNAAVKAVRAQDGTRPTASWTDIIDYSQGSTNQQTGAYDDASGLARMFQQADKPVMTVEIWTGFNDVEGMSGFFRKFYDTAYTGGGTGIIVQHLPFYQSVGFEPSWLSASGPGNRDADWRVKTCVNWCDPKQPPGGKEPYGRLFAGLYEKYTGRAPDVFQGARCPAVLVTGAPAGAVAFMLPAEAAAGPAQGLLSAPDGSAWFVLPRAGSYRLVAGAAAQAVEVAAQAGVVQPGYDSVQRVLLQSR